MNGANAPAPSPDWALFLDVDGTLIEFGDSPADTRASGELRQLLMAVERRLGGSLALVSGRSIDTLDALFAPKRYAAAGLHGGERRGAFGESRAARDDSLDGARLELREYVDSNRGALLEDKGSALALHYRVAPHLERSARRLLKRIVAESDGRFHIQEGDNVVEIKPGLATKAGAIDAFMSEAPFAGRLPVYVGDDITDRDGFRAVEARGGISVAVGDRVSAQYRLENPAAVRAWLAPLAAAWPPA